jgi:hypothetical protein
MMQGARADLSPSLPSAASEPPFAANATSVSDVVGCDFDVLDRPSDSAASTARASFGRIVPSVVVKIISRSVTLGRLPVEKR